MVLSVSKYFTLAFVDFREKFYYFGAQLFHAFFICVIIFIFFNIWKAIYAQKAVIEGFTFAQMLWYVAVAEVIVFCSDLRWIETVSDEIKTGVIGITLLKPMSYVLSRFALFLGNFFYKFIVVGVVAFFLALILAGPIDASILSIVLSFFSIILGVMLNFVIVVSLGFLAFWLEETSAIFWIYQKSIFILGGMLLPLDIYPDWIKGWIINLPFAYMVYKPAKLMIQFNFNDFLITLAWQ